MNLYPERADWDYAFVKNAEIVKEESPAAREVRFDSENLCSCFPWAKQMPFMETAFLAKDFEKSRQTFGRRFGAVRDGWPILEKLLVHEERGSLDLFNRVAMEAGNRRAIRTPLEMTTSLVKRLEYYGEEFFIDDGAAAKRVHDLVQRTKGKASINACLAYYEADNRLTSLWQQLTVIRKAWFKVYFIVAPIYWGLMWDPAKASLDDYTLCQKRLDELRPFFIDCFETLCRLSVLAAAFEGIAQLDQFIIPFPGSPKPVSELEVIPNGNKHTILSRLPIGDVFVPFIDAKLRNGVGHNDAHYDVTVDAIVYRNNSPSRGIEEFSISYIRFCEKLVRLYAQVEACAPLVHYLRECKARAAAP